MAFLPLAYKKMSLLLHDELARAEQADNVDWVPSQFPSCGYKFMQAGPNDVASLIPVLRVYPEMADSA